MIRTVLERLLGYMMSGLLHGVALAFLFLPWSRWLASGELASFAIESSHYIPISADSPHSSESFCRQVSCGAEGPKTSGQDGGALRPGEELEFLDDTGHVLVEVLRRVGGWVAVVSRADRWHTVAFYRAADGTNLGDGVELARFPLRVIVYEPGFLP